METNNSDVKKYSSQFQYNGEGPLDNKQNPVETVSELPTPLKAYEGQIITVLTPDENNIIWDYQFLNGKWNKKNQVIDCGEF